MNSWQFPLQAPISAPMKSPCTKICQIDQSSRLCRGCYRTIEEITSWAKMSDNERSRIMADLETRRLEWAEA